MKSIGSDYLEATIARRSDVSEVIVAGEIDMASAPELDATLAEAMEPAPKVLTIDLSYVTFCDSCGMSVLAHAATRCGRTSVRFHVVGASPLVKRTFELAGLSAII